MDVIQILTSLPASVTSGVLQSWLDLKSIKVFDSACCHKVARKDLINAIRSEENTMYEKVITTSSGVFKWMRNRSASARIIIIEDGMNSGQDLSSSANYLSIFGAKVDTVEILQGCSPTYFNIIQSVVQNCCNLKSVTFSCKRYGDDLGLSILRDVLRANRNVEKLCIDFKTNSFSIDDFALVLPFCHGLRCLRVASTPISDEVLVAFADACPHIAHLDISGCTNITDVGVEGVVMHLKGIQSLNITNCFSLTSESLELIYTHTATTLHTFHLNTMGSEGMVYSHDVLNKVFEACAEIRTLQWTENESESFYALPPSIRNVTTLMLVDEAVTDANLTTIAEHCTHLINLYLECSDNIEEVACTEAGLDRLVSRCTRLRELTLNGFYDHPAPNFEELVDAWRETKPQLHICEDEVGPACFEFDVMDL